MGWFPEPAAGFEPKLHNLCTENYRNVLVSSSKVRVMWKYSLEL